MSTTKPYLLLFTCLATLVIQAQDHLVREQLSLKGAWWCKLDSNRVGLAGNWQYSPFTEQVLLPGTLEENKKGRYVTQASTLFLNQTYKYEGPAWYKKEIELPASWKNKQVILFLERTKATRVWIDGKPVGQSTLLSAPHLYQLPGLQPGKHALTIMVDNTPSLFPVGGSHALSEHTQTNWNGIIGNMYLEAANDLTIKHIKVTPDVKNRTAQVQLYIGNASTQPKKIRIELQASTFNTPAKHRVAPGFFEAEVLLHDTLLTLRYALGPQALLWNEYTPALYQLTVSLRSNNQLHDHITTSFGLREFKAAGTQFRINDVVTFLRGNNETCVFPLTGYPPTDTASWRKLFRIAKQYGFNHYRFHSYTPPAAAFEAADVEGIYIQTELPNWATLTEKDTARTAFLFSEGKAILDAYGNHPSFVLFTLGNELEGDKTVHNKLVAGLRQYDSSRLYAHGTNAFLADPFPGKTDDFWVTMRTGKETPGQTFDVRASFAATEDTSNGLINATPPATIRNFSTALRGIQLPVVGHETGQYQIYPNYKEMAQYTGILRPLNFEIFKKRLADAGMADQATNFFRASGMLTALLYREEIEMALRTPGFAGFQLLGLQDFPGQGTALVGLLNAFMENKGFVSPAQFRRFNNDVVVQLLMDKYTWTNKETFTARVQVVNYSAADIAGKTLHWRIVTAGNKRIMAAGKLPVTMATKGRINAVGTIAFPLPAISKAEKLLVQLEIAGTAYETEYPVWVYPNSVDLTVPARLTIATDVDEGVIEKLQKGGRVLLFPDHKKIEQRSVGGQFISEFWNWLMFKGATERNNRKVSAGTLGIVTNPHHPLFRYFPTEFYTNWQWWSITKNARPLILDRTSHTFRPIVQVIDNIDRNHKLGMIIECKVGNGRLLVSMANLPALTNKPEARALYYSMLQYAASEQFDPQYEVSVSELKELL